MPPEQPYRGKMPVVKYKVIDVAYTSTNGWQQRLVSKLEEAAADGWRPILYGDSGGHSTIILERIE